MVLAAYGRWQYFHQVAPTAVADHTGNAPALVLIAGYVFNIAACRPGNHHRVTRLAQQRTQKYLLVLFQVLCMRWNVVIGGQLLSKTGSGFHEYHPEWLGKEGILAAIGVFLAPFVVLFVLIKILRPFEERPVGVPSFTVPEKQGWRQPVPPPRPRSPIPTKPSLWS